MLIDHAALWSMLRPRRAETACRTSCTLRRVAAPRRGRNLTRVGSRAGTGDTACRASLQLGRLRVGSAPTVVPLTGTVKNRWSAPQSSAHYEELRVTSARYSAELRMPSAELGARVLSSSIEPSNATTDYPYCFNFRPHWRGARQPA